MATRKELEAKLTPRQREAALFLVERDLSDDLDLREITLQDIADKIGISRQQLFNWRRNQSFIEYTNLVADDFLREKQRMVYRQLMRLIESPQPSTNAIKLFMQRFNLLTETKVVEEHRTIQRTKEDMAREIAELDELLDEE